MKRFYEAQPEDPYRVIWLYLAEQKLNGPAAMSRMRERLNKYDDDAWNWDLVRLYTGDINATQLMSNVVKGSRTTGSSPSACARPTSTSASSSWPRVTARKPSATSSWRWPTTSMTSSSIAMPCWSWN